MERNIYLESLDLEEAKRITEALAEKKRPLETEMTDTEEALGRVTACALKARVSSPCYNASAMDGVAVKAQDTEEASESSPVTLERKDYRRVNTGDMIPSSFDAVVMVEDVHELEKGRIRLYHSASSYENIRPIGEDIAQGSLVLPKSHRIRPIDIAALIAGGIEEIEVLKRPRIAILPTGEEIVRHVKDLKKGCIIDSNSRYLRHETESLGAIVSIYENAPDDEERIAAALKEAAKDHDTILVIAGSSAGGKDFTRNVVEKEGVLHLHGVNIKPGKPLIVGEILDATVFGIPGYPVSAFVSFEFLVRRFLEKRLRQIPSTRPVLKATLGKSIHSSLRHEEFVRVKVGKMDTHYKAFALQRGAGVSSSLVKADGLVRIPKHAEGLNAAEEVDVILMRPIAEIDAALVVTGSHDIMLDEIDDLLRDEDVRLSVSHVGSFGGVAAMKAGECHLAPVHIMDETGGYNRFLLEKYLPKGHVLIRGAGRMQGLYVKKGNPKNIRSLGDLTREDVTFVNRQRGSGTRILFEHLLGKEGIDAKRIKGYEQELSTHTAVAASVMDENFDCGMGVESVANIHGLDFLPIGKEYYDFLVKKDTLDHPKIRAFIKTLQSRALADRLERIGGYTLDDAGVISERGG